MIEMTWIPEFIRGVVWIYLLIWAALAVLAVWLPSSWKSKTGAVLLVVLVGGALPAYLALRVKQEVAEQKPIVEKRNAKLEVAMARFEERCKTAGEKVTRTVDKVDGIFYQWRYKVDGHDQFQMNDPYGNDCAGEDCIKNLVRASRGLNINPAETKKYAHGFRFVEATDPTDGRIYRYEGVIKLHPRWTPDAIAQEKKLTGKDVGPSDYRFSLERTLIEKSSANYSISWEDISTKEDREKWVAGGSLKVVDLKNQNLIAERVGYLIDRGQGSTEGFRDPWGWAWTYGPKCPRTSERSWEFSKRVLQPTHQGE